jgi:catechol 2,3-dioxygenase-like lactoylglutathione lyase family enzyme
MALSRLDHCSIRTTRLEETRDFYVELLGMRDGERPDFPFPGNWLYVGDDPVVHLVGIDADDPSGLQEYLGDADPATLVGGGAVDHVAFRGVDAPAQMARLEAAGVAFRRREVPGMDLMQIFVDDPNGVTLELNYFGEGA